MSDMAMKYEDWLRGCVHHDGRKGNVYLPCGMVLKIADWIEAHRDVAPRWIPCEERLPECKTVLVTCNSDIEFGIYRKARNEWAIWEDSRWVWGVDVTAWMPLPEPYEGERKDDE